MEVLLTGGRPTGSLHFGHYLGAFKKTVDIHKSFKSFFVISNFHMITTKKNKLSFTEMPENIIGMVAECLAMGMEEEFIRFYVQSSIELFPKFYTLIQNYIDVKDLMKKESLNEMCLPNATEFSFGLLGYSVMESADILGMKAERIPVGIDNLDHLDISAQIVDKFKDNTGIELQKPKPVKSVSANLIGLDGIHKMSKSLGNCIYLKDKRDTIFEKLASVQEPIREIVFNSFQQNLEKHFDISDLTNYHQLIEAVIEIVDPIACKRAELIKDKGHLKEIIDRGTEEANERYSKNVMPILESLGLNNGKEGMVL